MGQGPMSTAATAAVEPIGDAAARRALAEVLCRPVTGWSLTNLEADQDTVGAMVQRQVLQETVEAVLAAAGWRPPVPTLTSVGELDAVPVGAVLTDRYGQIWIRTEQGWGEPCPAEVEVGELVEWAPLTVHVVVADGSASEEAR